MKYIMIIAVVLGLGLWTGAEAATKFGPQFIRATLFGVVEESKPIHKVVDGAVTCYTYGASISCVK